VQVLNFTSVKLKHFAKQAMLLKTLKSDGGHAISRQEKRWLPKKHHAISRQEKKAFSTPRHMVLELPSPIPQSLYGRAYADVTTKISGIDLPNLLSKFGAPLAS